MLVTCSCGKKLFFGDDPNEEQACDRCGQKIRSPLSGDSRRLEAVERSSPRRGLPRQRSNTSGPPQQANAPPPKREYDSVRLYIASARRSPAKMLGCLAVLLLIAGAVVGLDFLANPVKRLPCGHKAKPDYMFGLVPGHTCDTLVVLRYLESVRRELRALEEGRVGVLMRVKELHKSGYVDPPPEKPDYEYTLNEDRTVSAYPASTDEDAPHYLIERNGDIRMERGRPATELSPVIGRFDD
jgi:hypothetical protein